MRSAMDWVEVSAMEWVEVSAMEWVEVSAEVTIYDEHGDDDMT